MPQRSYRVSSEAIRGHQRPSEAIRETHRIACLGDLIERLLAELVPFVGDDATERSLDFECRRAAEAQIESVVGERFDLRRSSEVIRGHQRSSGEGGDLGRLPIVADADDGHLRGLDDA